MPRDENQPRPLHYAGPAQPHEQPPAYRPPLRFAAGLARPIWLFTAVLIGITMFIVPLTEATFRQFNTNLPGTTKALLLLSRLMRNYFLWLPVAALGIAAPFLIARLAAVGADEDDTRLRIRMITAAVFVLGALLTLWVVLSLFVPYLNLIQSAAGK